MPPETENEPVTPAGTSAVNFASSPAAAPPSIEVATPLTNEKSLKSSATVPSSGSARLPSGTEKTAPCVGFKTAPAWSVSVEEPATPTVYTSVPPSLTTIG